MDAFSLIPSKDVADYCKTIGYTLNPIEIACLISKQYGMTISEKNAQYKELIQCYPNAAFHESVKFRGGSWLHEYLDALIKWNEGAIDFLHETPKKEANPFVYRIGNYDRKRLGLPLAEHDTFEDAVYSVQPHWDIIHASPCCKDYVRIRKERKTRENNSLWQYMDAAINEEGDLLWFNTGERLVLSEIRCPGELYRLKLFLPVPFEIGDIIIGRDNLPCILETLPLRELSCTDLQYYGEVTNAPPFATVFYITPNGELAESYVRKPFSKSWGVDTSGMKYYKGELKGMYKSFPSLSAYIKNEGVENFISEYVKNS